MALAKGKKAPIRRAIHVDIPVDAYETIYRLCVFMERSQAKLLEILVIQAENDWLAKMTPAEQKAYKSEELRLEDWRSAFAKKRA